jgi:conjugal transfer/entry exclusion protein
MFTFSLITVFNVKFDISIWANIVIAIATCVATAIHVDNQIKLRKTRVWDINKDVLLKLSSILAKVIEDLEKAMDYYFDEIQNIAHETGITYDYPKELYENFSNQTFEVLNVYKPLISKALISSLEELKSTSDKVDMGVNEGELNLFEAYNRILLEHIKLQGKLNTFIKQVSGVQYT